MQIAAADADGADPYLDLARARIGNGLFSEAKFAGSNQFGDEQMWVPGTIVKYGGMLNFREFEAGPDPFGRKFNVLFKWLQTAISIRHADTVDVKFVLVDENGERAEKTIALPHAELQQVSRGINRGLDDAWCARIAAHHLLHLVATGEDMEKALVTLSRNEIEIYAAEIATQEKAILQAR